MEVRGPIGIALHDAVIHGAHRRLVVIGEIRGEGDMPELNLAMPRGEEKEEDAEGADLMHHLHSGGAAQLEQRGLPGGCFQIGVAIFGTMGARLVG